MVDVAGNLLIPGDTVLVPTSATFELVPGIYISEGTDSRGRIVGLVKFLNWRTVRFINMLNEPEENAARRYYRRPGKGYRYRQQNIIRVSRQGLEVEARERLDILENYLRSTRYLR